MLLSYREQSVPIVLAAVYTDFSIKDMHLLLWEIFYILTGFFGMTLILIVILRIAARPEPVQSSGLVRHSGAPVKTGLDMSCHAVIPGFPVLFKIDPFVFPLHKPVAFV